MLDRELRHLIAAQTPLHTTAALAQTVLDLITSGAIPAETRLPTIRTVAADLAMSPSAVAAAWRTLAQLRVVQTRRRGGTVVLGPPPDPIASRFDRMVRAGRDMPIDLGNIYCDPDLLPTQAPVFERVLQGPNINRPAPPWITPELRAAVESLWPFEADEYVAVHAGMDGVEAALFALVKPGDRVMVEEPSFARVFDLLEAVGATALSIPIGPAGPDLAAIRRALVDKPTALIYQPFGHIPTGRSVSADWLTRAAKLLGGTSVSVIEMVTLPFLAGYRPPSLGTSIGQQVVQIQNFVISHGPDLRVAILGGGHPRVQRILGRLTYSSRWVSRILQNALATHLTDPRSIAAVEHAAAVYHSRHENLVTALARDGLRTESTAGLSVWVSVLDEHITCMRLAREGISVLPGFLFHRQPVDTQHIHLNAGAVHDPEAFVQTLRQEPSYHFGTD